MRLLLTIFLTLALSSLNLDFSALVRDALSFLCTASFFMSAWMRFPFIQGGEFLPLIFLTGIKRLQSSEEDVFPLKPADVDIIAMNCTQPVNGLKGRAQIVKVTSAVIVNCSYKLMHCLFWDFKIENDGTMVCKQSTLQWAEHRHVINLARHSSNNKVENAITSSWNCMKLH